MATAKVIDYRQTQSISATGQVQQEITAEFQVEGLSGVFQIDPIPQDQFSRDEVIKRVTVMAEQLLPEKTDVTVQLPAGQ